MDPVHIRIQQKLDRIMYKPGWEFSAEYDGITSVTIVIRVEVQNTYNPMESVWLSSRDTIYPELYTSFMDNDKEFADYMFRRIKEMEIHESREWFRLDGEIYDNPHNE